MALLRRPVEPKQYASGDYRADVNAAGMVCSMSAKGRCYDNAVAESFFHSLKVELIYGRRLTSREEAMSAIFRYIEGYYNTKRLHSSLDYTSPADYEQAALLRAA
jgi:putative transposase